MSDGNDVDGNDDDSDDEDDEDEDGERNLNFIVLTYINQPDPDDICALHEISSIIEKIRQSLNITQRCM